MLGFVENIGHKYDFQGGWSLVGGGGGGVQIQRKKFQQIINTYFQCRWININV